MADELITFPETEAVLKELADVVMAEYKRQLVKDGHFTYFGRDRLVDTITAEVDRLILEPISVAFARAFSLRQNRILRSNASITVPILSSFIVALYRKM